MRKEVFHRVQGFDEKLPIAFNELDLCMKLRASGYLIVWTPFAELYHDQLKTLGNVLAPDKIESFNSCLDRVREIWGDLLEKGDPYFNPNLRLDTSDYTEK